MRNRGSEILISVLSVLAVCTTSIFILLKLIGLVMWPMFVIVLPCLIVFAVFVLMFIVCVIAFYINEFLRWRDRRKYR